MSSGFRTGALFASAPARIKKKTKPVGTVERISVYGEHDLDKLGVPPALTTWEVKSKTQ